ncbi:Phage tail tube protein FII [Serratia marcescens]|uniref:Phage tail tube protein FII n=1 Tax=Serratia marcescens TaxID=615 RepID=A0A380A4G2_SERMA|nr:Phage tail tube protein FII [Serratia marcescens]
MQGAVAVDLGLDGGALDASMVVGGVVEELILKYGGGIDEMRLRFVGEIYSGGTSSLMEVEMRGRITEIDQVRPSRAMTPTIPTPSRTPTTSCRWMIRRCWKLTC